jgi:hypothetical protein
MKIEYWAYLIISQVWFASNTKFGVILGSLWLAVAIYMLLTRNKQ